MPTLKTKAALFKAAGRKRDFVKIGADTLEVTEMCVDDRFDFVDYAKTHNGDNAICYAFLLSRCCPALHGTTPEEIKDNLRSDVLATAATMILNLSGIAEPTKKKPSPKKKGSSTD